MGHSILIKWSAVAIAAVMLSISGSAQAALSYNFDGNTFVANDSFDWDSQTVASLPNGTPLQTVGGVAFSASNTQNNLNVSEGGGFSFAAGGANYLIAPVQSSQAITLTFATAIKGFGTTVEWGGFQDATYTLSVFGAGNALLGSTSIQSGANGAPKFLGVVDSLASITGISIAYAAGDAQQSAAMSDLLIDTGAVPEPATWAMMIGGFALVGAAMRRRATIAFA